LQNAVLEREEALQERRVGGVVEVFGGGVEACAAGRRGAAGSIVRRWQTVAALRGVQLL
jgi:hypothetical protein